MMVFMHYFPSKGVVIEEPFGSSGVAAVVVDSVVTQFVGDFFLFLFQLCASLMSTLTLCYCRGYV
jgi:hypothetical protein